MPTMPCLSQTHQKKNDRGSLRGTTWRGHGLWVCNNGHFDRALLRDLRGGGERRGEKKQVEKYYTNQRPPTS